ncbi:hypothetical protein UlMin_003495 [Ulmus minor]
MAKLTSSAILFTFLLFTSHASAYRTIITASGDEPKPCREEIQGKGLFNCLIYLGEQMYGHGTDQFLDRCCEQMGEVGERCRCPGLDMEISFQEGLMSGEQIKQMKEIARNLPSKCKMEPQSCQFQSLWV